MLGLTYPNGLWVSMTAPQSLLLSFLCNIGAKKRPCRVNRLGLCVLILTVIRFYGELRMAVRCTNVTSSTFRQRFFVAAPALLAAADPAHHADIRISLTRFPSPVFIPSIGKKHVLSAFDVGILTCIVLFHDTPRKNLIFTSLKGSNRARGEVDWVF
jgi:hypothetical protein